MSKATASTATSARDVMTREEGMALGMGVAVGVAVGMAEVEGEMMAVVELVRVVELLEAVGLVELVELVGPGLVGLGTKVVALVVSSIGGVDVVETVVVLIYCSLLHRERKLMV